MAKRPEAKSNAKPKATAGHGPESGARSAASAARSDTPPSAPPRSSPPPPREARLERGTQEHYLDPEIYDHEYKRRRADVNYYRALCGGRLMALPLSPPRQILELGAGTGRLLVPLVKDGHHVVGVDASQPMLERCAERLSHLAPAARDRAELVRGDFRHLSLGRRFHIVLCPFNAMMHLYTRDDLERFLDVVRAHLVPGGLFAFDVMNPDIDWLVRDPSRRWARTRFKDPHDGSTWYYSTNHVYDASSQINWIRLYYDQAPVAGDGGAAGTGGAGGATDGLPPIVKSRVVHLAQRQLFPCELEELLHYNGFSIDTRDGGFVGEPFESDSYSQVCRCSIQGAPRR